MTIYDDIKAVVADVLPEFKQGVVALIKVTAGDGPDDNPGAATLVSSNMEATVSGVAFKYVSQGLAVVTDLEVTAVVLDSISPSEKDFIDIDSVRYKVVQFMPIPNAGVAVIWKFIVRKGG